MRRRRAPVLLVAMAWFGSSGSLFAQPVADSTPQVRFGAFVDTYYAYDFGKPQTLDRSFTTQAARHAEFNVNLAHLDAKLTSPRLRGRIAAQFGTSVQANYAAEPRVGTLSGPDVMRFIQEATIGFRAAPGLWLDAGVFFAPFGSESWISSDNWTYTRSLIADNSPYYQSGVRATWLVTPRFTAQVHVINGWQNVSESNSDKALAVRFDYSPASRFLVAYDAFVGNEQPDTLRDALRTFHEVTSRFRVSQRIEIAGTLDYGRQRMTATAPHGVWRGWSALGRYQASRSLWLAGRVERYSDPHQIIVATGKPYGLRASGASLNLDVAPQPGLLWRFEARALRADDRLFADRGNSDGLSTQNVVLVSSLALRVD